MTGPAGGGAVLVIGLDPYRVPGPWDPEPVARAIETGMAKLAEQGLAAEACLVGLNGSDDSERRVAAALQAQPWDCVVVGSGIRKAEELVELFEEIVNLIREHAPQAEIAFSSAPADIFDAISRRLHTAP